jgi:hypothetical protein
MICKQALVRLAHGDLLPEINDSADLRFYALPQSYHVLGALPQPAATVISTRRQGIRSFDHVAFSRIQRSKDGKNYQLYRWEYLFAETFVGYVLHEDEQALGALHAIQNYGCKLGKEGWAYVEQLEGPFVLKEQSARAVPSSIVAAPEAFGGASRIYPLFRYAWREDTGIPHELGVGPAPIEGFVSFLAATMKTPVELNYYQGNGASIPVSLLRYF